MTIVEPVRDSILRRATRVLIVDDHELLRFGLADLLDHQDDVEVCGQAASESQAWKLALATKPDLAIIDIALDEGNGLDLIKRLRHRCPTLRIVVLSTYDESLYAERALRAGAHGYINKQTPARQIIAAIRKVLKGQVYLSERMTQQMVQRAAGAKSNPSPVEMLSDRELEVFTLIGRALTSAEIAKELHLSRRTVDTYRERLKVKLSLQKGTELSRLAMQWVLENQ